jgi:hypothetical protein
MYGILYTFQNFFSFFFLQPAILHKNPFTVAILINLLSIVYMFEKMLKKKLKIM